MKGLMQVFYTHKRTEVLLAAKGIKAKVLKVSVTRPSGKFYACVHVIYRTAHGVCSMFISCKEYLQRAIANRKQAATEYFVSDTDKPNEYHVYGKDADLLVQPGYTVTATAKGVICECADYKSQSVIYEQHPYLWKQILKGHQLCKHGISVLNSLNCSSLSQYLKKQRMTQIGVA